MSEKVGSKCLPIFYSIECPHLNKKSNDILKVVIFDFNKWLEGENVNVRQIKGMLDYHRPFVNMG